MCIPGDDPQNCGIDPALFYEWFSQHLDALAILGIILLVVLLSIPFARYLERRK